MLPPNGWVPNNGRLPVIVYRHAFDADAPKLAEQIETRFAHHAWPVQWRNGVFDFHHFHSTAHEVLGVFAGAAELIVGGPGGRMLPLAAGDVLLLPAGTGHCLVSRTDAFHVAGGYPAGQQWDIRREALTPDELRAMDALPFPASDPVYGARGPVIERWRKPA
ncbi:MULTISPECIES: cupin domain-containing protein [Paraburkholderia]|uniref:cupin domain-containing protein n=1 Tax=Paraburkholderia TaxID=1822464 RepID=UPI001CC58B0E|nr:MULTISPECIES: cupin domain-containing protein [Paraburkholderia]